MSDVTPNRLPNRLKVSREGVALIKSFEGFRAQAALRGDGQWVIGYGHTRTARSGASVSENDAEMLLQYDLIEVVAAIHEASAVGLNQHQFDALASFAFSIGAARFRLSSVFQKLKAGQLDAAAQALAEWPEAPSFDAPQRRRTAERALFDTPAATPAALIDLLTTPLPPFPALGAMEPDRSTATSDTVSPSAQAATDGIETASAPVSMAIWGGQTTAASGDKPAPLDFGQIRANIPEAPEIEPKKKRDWSETGPLLFIGAVGLFAAGGAVAAFRRASAQTIGAGETVTVAWVLTLIAAILIGVSLFSLGRGQRVKDQSKD